MDELGVIHGRFQIFHNDHLKYLLAGKERCRHLVVAITNPDPEVTKEDPADPQRSSPMSNPLTYFERYSLVRAVLEEASVSPQEFSIVPFPINVPGLYRYYVPLSATFYLTIYDEWGKKKLEQFRSLGLRTEVLWWKSLKEKGITGRDVRERIVRGKPWEHLVPPCSAALLKQWEVPKRIREHYDSLGGDEATS